MDAFMAWLLFVVLVLIWLGVLIESGAHVVRWMLDRIRR